MTAPHAPYPVNRSIPPVIIMPVLGYRDVRAAVEWLCRVFGFEERLQIADHRSQLTFGDGAVVAAGWGASGEEGGAALGSHSVLVRVLDIDRHYARVVAAGARVGGPPVDHPYGERQYSVTDPGGHRWTFSETIANSDPASWGGILKESS